jgi:hypothetical protein
MKYRLRSPHVIEGAVRNAGTVVGDDDDCPVKYYGDPTPDMEGLDDASRDKINEVHKRLHGIEAPWHRDPEHEDPRFRPPAIEEPALEQDRKTLEEYRQRAEMSPADLAKHDDEAGKALREQNAIYHGSGGTAPAETIPPAGASRGTYVKPASVETPQEQVQRPDTPLKQQLPATGEIAQRSPPSPTPPARTVPRQPDKEG